MKDFTLTDHTQEDDTGSKCNITNKSEFFYDIESINKHVQSCCGSILTTNKHATFENVEEKNIKLKKW